MAERVIRSIRKLFKSAFFEKVTTERLSEFPSIAKQYTNSVQHSNRMTPIQASKKIYEKT